MVMVTAGVFTFASIFLIASMIAKKSTQRKLKSVAFSIANEIGYALVVFTTPNIIIATCIEV